jgi:exo-1,4-beta-D-glucosaminidase
VSEENTITLENKSDVVAFFVRMDLKHNGNVLLPILWSDNLVTLQPGETLTINTNGMNICGIDAELVISGWNVSEQKIEL